MQKINWKQKQKKIQQKKGWKIDEREKREQGRQCNIEKEREGDRHVRRA